MRFAWFFPALVYAVCLGPPMDLTCDQRLIVACHSVDVDGVVFALRAGGNVNARFGHGNVMWLRDRWNLGWPVAASKWTPLIALANASDFPNPPRDVKNSMEDLEWAHKLRREIPAAQIRKRCVATLKIAQLLLSHKPDTDLHDGYGATPLYESIYLQKDELAKLLLRSGAKVNTTTQVRIDGVGKTTPLHRASYSLELTKLLLERGADAEAMDSAGRTPADWAQHSADPAVVRLYDSRNRITKVTPLETSLSID